jgi:hypothetical protein
MAKARITYRVSWLEDGNRVFAWWSNQREALALAQQRMREGRIGVEIKLDWE